MDRFCFLQANSFSVSKRLINGLELCGSLVNYWDQLCWTHSDLGWHEGKYVLFYYYYFNFFIFWGGYSFNYIYIYIYI